MSHSCGGKDLKKMTPVETLKAEHRVIERVLDAVETMAAAPRIDEGFFKGAIDFLRNFADGCHHAKEEDILFPELERAGVPREGGPIGCMLHEHEQGRLLIRRMVESLDAAAEGSAVAVAALRRAVAEYVSLLRQHIDKEDNVLFVMAESALHPERVEAMSAAFERVESEHAEPDRHERYLALAEELTRRAADRK